MIQIREIDHLVLRVVDLSAMLRFYCDGLGCRVERRQDEIGLIQLRAGRSMLDLVPLDGKLGRAGGAAPGREGRNLDHLCLRVEPFDEAAIRAHRLAGRRGRPRRIALRRRGRRSVDLPGRSGRQRRRTQGAAVRMSALGLRHARVDDLGTLITLCAQLNPDDPPPVRGRLAPILDRVVKSDDFAIVVATLDHAVVATCCLDVVPNLTRGDVEVDVPWRALRSTLRPEFAAAPGLR